MLPRRTSHALPLAVLAVAGAPALASANSFSPDCVSRGQTTTVQHSFSSSTQMTLQTALTALTPIVYDDERGVIELFGDKHEIRTQRSPLTYSPSPGQPVGIFDIDFTQPVPVPSAKAYDGMPVVGFATQLIPFDADGRQFNNSGTVPNLFVGGRRVLMPETVRLGFNSVERILVLGIPKASVYAHLINSRGKQLRQVRLRRTDTRNSCGLIDGGISFEGARPGTLPRGHQPVGPEPEREGRRHDEGPRQAVAGASGSSTARISPMRWPRSTGWRNGSSGLRL